MFVTMDFFTANYAVVINFVIFLIHFLVLDQRAQICFSREWVGVLLGAREVSFDQ